MAFLFIYLIFKFNRPTGKHNIELENLPIPQPLNKDIEVKSFVTESGLKVVHVNPKSKEKTTSFSLSVGVGSRSDLKELKGFTHLIEHLIFLGSQKYPEFGSLSNVM